MRAARMAIGTLFFVLGFAFATWVSRLPEVQAALALSPAALGGALAGLGAGSLVAMPLSGWLIAHAGSRLVASVSTLASAATLVLPAFAWDAVALGAALTLFGAAMGAMDVSVNAQGVELEHRAGRPILSAFHALFSLAGCRAPRSAVSSRAAAWRSRCTSSPLPCCSASSPPSRFRRW